MSVKKALIILIILGAIGASAFYFLSKDKTAVEYTTAAVTRGKIIQTVDEVGTVKASKEIDLNFLNAGQIQKMNVKIGDTVKGGQVLAELDYSSLLISQKELQANLDISMSNYNKLIAGASSQEVTVARAGEQQAKAAYESAQNELIKTKGSVLESVAQAQKSLSDLEESTPNDVTAYEQAVVTAKTNFDNAKSTYGRVIENYKESVLSTVEDKLASAKTTLDIIDRTINDEDGENLISIENIAYLENTKKDYRDSIGLLSKAEIALAATKSNNGIENYNLLLSDALTALNKVFSALQNCFTALENSVTSSDFTLTDLNALKTGISTEKSTVAVSITSIQSAQQKLNDAVLNYETNVSSAENALTQVKVAYDGALLNARNALATAQVGGESQIAAAQSRARAQAEAYQVAKAQLSKVLASADKNDIALSEAKIRQAQASLDSISKKIEDSMIKAPIDGTITKVNYEVGEQLKAGLSPISMLGENNFVIEVLISEADIAKIKKDQPCVITLDAYGEDVEFPGKIDFIEPAETQVQDVVYYKITIVFDPGKEEVKSGMTANVSITTAAKDSVLIVPNRAVLNKGEEGRIARVLVNGVLVEKKITVGLSGDDGLVEVLSGLNEGEMVVTYINE